MNRDYNEFYELRRYIWQNYRHALTDREHKLHLAALLELKARHASSHTSAEGFRARPGYFFDDDVSEIAEMGLSAYQQKCCDRLLNDFEDQIYINRCERCERILSSPIACACVWCGHHWYERRSEMMTSSKSSIYPPPNQIRAEQGAAANP